MMLIQISVTYAPVGRKQQTKHTYFEEFISFGILPVCQYLHVEAVQILH